MRNLTRFLFMFGPMIFRQIQKYQRKQQKSPNPRSNQRPQNPPRRQPTTTPAEVIVEDRPQTKAKNSTPKATTTTQSPRGVKEDDIVEPINRDKPFSWRDIFFKEE